MRLPICISDCINRLETAGYSAYVVGGCVRDSILGLPPHDYDIATSALPDEIKTVFIGFKTIDTGIKHGTVTVITEKRSVEITTYRIDGEYGDGRHPDSVCFTDKIESDLSRRDLTINAIAYNERTGFIDPFGGEDDINAGIIRTVGNANERFNEDALRILRTLRFSSTYGMRIEDKTAAAVHRCAALIMRISPERIREELNRFLMGNCVALLNEYIDVFGVFLPELLPTLNFNQHTKYHDRDVWKHTLGALSAIEPKLQLRLTMLIHDLGKPESFRMSDGAGHFHGHAEVSAEIAENILRRLKYPRETIDYVVLLVRNHDIVIRDDEKSVKKLLSRFGADTFFDLVKVHIADDSGKNLRYRNRIEMYKNAYTVGERIIAASECLTLRQLAVKGEDIVALGYSGPEVGMKLEELLSAVIEGECNNDRDKLLKLLEKN